MTTTNNPLPAVDLPCPPWCTMTPGHGWDWINQEWHAVRVHEQHYSTEESPHYVSVTAQEAAPAVNCCGDQSCAHPIVTTGPPATASARVSVDLETDLDPDDAETVAEWIRQAAAAARRYRIEAGR